MVLSHSYNGHFARPSAAHGMSEQHRPHSSHRLNHDNAGYEAQHRGVPPSTMAPGMMPHASKAAPPPPPPTSSSGPNSRMSVSYILNSSNSGGYAPGPVAPYSSRSQHHPAGVPPRPPVVGVPSEVVSSSASTHAEALRPNYSSTSGRSAHDGSSSSSRSRDVPYSAPALQCETCGKTFKDRGNLRKHRKSVHNPDPRPFMCPVAGCSKGFSFKDGLTRHVQTVHEGQRPYQCEVPNCGMRFKQRTHLAKHTQHRHKPQ